LGFYNFFNNIILIFIFLTNAIKKNSPSPPPPPPLHRKKIPKTLNKKQDDLVIKTNHSNSIRIQAYY
jgi:hypothetical protein